MHTNSRVWVWLGLVLVLVIAAFFRWKGLAWDDGYLFHPDERQIALVVSNLRLPASLSDFFSPESSLNPKFFAYGSLPIYLLRVMVPLAPPTEIVGPWSDDQLARWVLFGRWLSGLFDIGTVALTFALGRRAYNARIGLFAAACVALTVLHIQLAHFYAVDTLLAFFMSAALYAALRVGEAIPDRTSIEMPDKDRSITTPAVPRKWLVLCGITFGLALATKMTAASLALPILYACARAGGAPALRLSRAQLGEIWRALRRPFLQIVGIALLVFVVLQPYAVIDWYNFGRDVIRETFVARGWLDYPYTRQFAGTLPIVYQVTQSSLWGMGVPLGIFAWGGGILFLWQCWKMRAWRDTFLVSFALFYFFTIAFQHAKYLRYVLPLLPVLYIIAACAWMRVLGTRRVVVAALGILVLGASLLYALAFTQIYTREHPWLTASRWIYQNVPSGSTLAVEEWDDALPVQLELGGIIHFGSEYPQVVLHMYDDDSDEKRSVLAKALAQADGIVLASPRLYASIGRNAARYPLTTGYYEKLFDGDLGFVPVMTARNDPGLFGISICDDPFAGLPYNAARVRALLPNPCTWNWGFADESLSVYDHPQPIVFLKTRVLSAAELENLLRP